jgi:primosomal protein N'
MNCEVCYHADHDAGRCKQCNCGSSEVVATGTGLIAQVIDRDFAGTLARCYERTEKECLGKGDYQYA